MDEDGEGDAAGGNVDSSSSTAGAGAGTGSAKDDGRSDGGRSAATATSVLKSSDPLERVKIKAKGIIWKRDSMELGGNFRKCYAVLEKGKLDFYKSEDVRARP